VVDARVVDDNTDETIHGAPFYCPRSQIFRAAAQKEEPSGDWEVPSLFSPLPIRKLNDPSVIAAVDACHQEAPKVGKETSALVNANTVTFYDSQDLAHHSNHGRSVSKRSSTDLPSVAAPDNEAKVSMQLHANGEAEQLGVGSHAQGVKITKWAGSPSQLLTALMASVQVPAGGAHATQSEELHHHNRAFEDASQETLNSSQHSDASQKDLHTSPYPAPQTNSSGLIAMLQGAADMPGNIVTNSEPHKNNSKLVSLLQDAGIHTLPSPKHRNISTKLASVLQAASSSFGSALSPESK